MNRERIALARVVALLFATTLLHGCIGTLIGVTTDAAIEVAKVPFKVGGAVVDVVAGEDDDDDDDDD